MNNKCRKGLLFRITKYRNKRSNYSIVYWDKESKLSELCSSNGNSVWKIAERYGRLQRAGEVRARTGRVAAGARAAADAAARAPAARTTRHNKTNAYRNYIHRPHECNDSKCVFCDSDCEAELEEKHCATLLRTHPRLVNAMFYHTFSYHTASMFWLHAQYPPCEYLYGLSNFITKFQFYSMVLRC